jgi:hypothetical protein
MKRRGFLKSVAQVAAIAPLAGNIVLPQDASEGESTDVPVSNINDLLDLSPNPDIEGYSYGVSAIDEATNGFFPGQLVCVYGAFWNITGALLYRTAFSNALKGKYVEVLVTKCHSSGLYKAMFGSLSPKHQQETEFPSSDFYKALFGFLSPKHRQEIDSILMERDSKGREHLRISDLYLGDPSQNGWRTYVQQISDDPPEILILDGVVTISAVLGEKQMAKQLKTLAKKLHIPILVNPPPRKHPRSDMNHPSNSIQEDFEARHDVMIGLFPKYVCKIKRGANSEALYYAIKTYVSSLSCPCSKCKGYMSEIDLQFNEIGLRFTGG